MGEFSKSLVREAKNAVADVLASVNGHYFITTDDGRKMVAVVDGGRIKDAKDGKLGGVQAVFYDLSLFVLDPELLITDASCCTTLVSMKDAFCVGGRDFEAIKDTDSAYQIVILEALMTGLQAEGAPWPALVVKDLSRMDRDDITIFEAQLKRYSSDYDDDCCYYDEND
jgi:hypothetical protein